MLPILLAVGMAAMSAAGSGLAAQGQAQAGRDAYKNAARQANRIQINSEFSIVDVERKRLRTTSEQRAQYSAMGVRLDGSPLELLAETNALAAQDIGRIQYQAREEAEQVRREGSAALSNSKYAAVGSILGGVGKAASAAASGFQLGKALG